MPPRGSISVCMATFNGSRFIQEQLQSILWQLESTDEVIVVDDGSQDATVNTILALNDRRIQLQQNEENRGVVRSFERTIRAATGEYIFLSDQDDIWCEGKVATIVSAFDQHPDVTLVSTNVDLIDENGQIIQEGYPHLRIGTESKYGKLARNLYRNRYLGCTLAFRAQTIPFILPFPPDVPMHDMWIGMINDLVGKTLYLDQHLIKYRRHDSNATTGRPLHPVVILRHRLILVRRLAQFAFRSKIKSPIGPN